MTSGCRSSSSRQRRISTGRPAMSSKASVSSAMEGSVIRSGSLPDDGAQPSHHFPRRLKILPVVREDLVHDLVAQAFVGGLGRLDIASHRPLAARFLELALEAGEELDGLE